MGTDIRAFVEYRQGEAWYAHAELFLERAYSLFALIAGVRSEGTSLMVPRGLPDDASGPTQEAYFVWDDEQEDLAPDPDATAPSWLLFSELAEILGSEPVVMNWELTLQTMRAIEQNFHAETRLVFWFRG